MHSDAATARAAWTGPPEATASLVPGRSTASIHGRVAFSSGTRCRPRDGGVPTVGAFSLRPIADEERDGFRLHLERFHYLGFERSVGESLGYAAFLGNELVALLDWGAAVLHCEPRERYIGWDSATRSRHLGLVVNNRRFLILPWIRQPHLASRVLGANLRRLSTDWAAVYGHPVALAETFVDTTRYRGTCYRASNWVHVGETRGFSRTRHGFAPNERPKSVFVYPLMRDALARLRA